MDHISVYGHVLMKRGAIAKITFQLFLGKNTKRYIDETLGKIHSRDEIACKGFTSRKV